MSSPEPKRPVFHKQLGDTFAGLRKAKGWSVQEAVNHSKAKHPDVLTWNILTRLERGKTKHPDADALRALCDLYNLDYRDIASAYITANYGRDLLRHEGDQESGSSSGGLDVATARRIADLERQIADHQTQLREVQDVAKRLVLIAGRAEDARNATGGRGRRKRRAS